MALNDIKVLQEQADGNLKEVLLTPAAIGAATASATYATLANFPVTGEVGRLYLALNTSRIFYWNGSIYVEISPSSIVSDPSGITGADAITNIMSLTQAEYHAIGFPNATTLYVITDP